MADLKVNLVDCSRIKEPGAHHTMRVSRRCCGKIRTLDITLKRTIRVPDNTKSYNLPPNMGTFPIYNVRDFASKLPPHLAEKGGIFIPIYQREAMWIRFTCTHPFAVKVFVGGVNAVSGKSHFDLRQMITRQQAHLDKSKSTQDYLVPPTQLWLDGVATSDGKVMQFVATPVASGYSIEAQVTGDDNIAGIQFEITPKHLDSYFPISRFKLKPVSLIYAKTLTGKVLDFPVAPCYTIGHIKALILQREGIPIDQQRLVCADMVERCPPDASTLSSLGIPEGYIFWLVLSLSGGGQSKPLNESIMRDMEEMTLGAGGSIKQVIHKDESNPKSWDANETILFNLQLFDPIYFKHTLGINAPTTPIGPTTYAKLGYPFFKLYEQPSGIVGNFNLRSMGTLDKENGLNSSLHEEEKDLTFPTTNIMGRCSSEVQLNNVDWKTTFVPLEELAIRLRKDDPSSIS